MAAYRYIDVGLELEVGAEPIAGRIRHGGATPRAFGGWLELAAALEDALRTGHGPEADPPKARGAARRGRRAKDT